MTGQNTTINNLERNSMKKMMKCVVALGIAAVFPMALIAGDCKTECAEAVRRPVRPVLPRRIPAR